MSPRQEWDTTPISIDGPQGWDSNRTAIRGEMYCPWWLTFLDPSTGQVFDFGNKCRSFTHRPCAEKRVTRLLDHIGPYLFNSQREIWVAFGVYDDGFATRMRVRRQTHKKETGDVVHAFWVKRKNGLFFYFATEEMDGDKTPEYETWHKSESAFSIARAALTLPGIGDQHGRKGYNFSQWWKPSPEKSQANGLVRIAQKEPVAVAIAEEAARRLGAGPPREPQWGNGLRSPEGVDLETWNAMVKTVASEMTETRRESFGRGS